MYLKYFYDPSYSYSYRVHSFNHDVSVGLPAERATAGAPRTDHARTHPPALSDAP